MERSTLALSFRKELRGCTACPLHQGCTAPVPWYGELSPDIAVVGEAPGQTEDAEGKPFVGSAGNMLRALLREADIDPAKVTYMNSVQCYPHRGLDPLADKEYVDVCRKWMRGQVAFIQPKYVISVGVIAFQSIRNEPWPKLRELHGKPLYWDGAPYPAQPIVWPTYHPSAALRSGKYKRLILSDLREFQQWRKGGEAWPSECFVCGEELHRYTGWGVGLCERHCLRQGSLFPEEVA